MGVTDVVSMTPTIVIVVLESGCATVGSVVRCDLRWNVGL